MKKNIYIFLLLELISLGIMQYNTNNVLLKSANYIVKKITIYAYHYKKYFSLKLENKQLLYENQCLKEENLAQKQQLFKTQWKKQQITFKKKYILTTAQVINNSIHHRKNYLTINKGSKDGIQQGMGVINNHGIIGTVCDVSKNFSTVISLLHTSILTSAQIKKNNILGTIQWNGKNSSQAKLLYIPRHVQINIQDTVVTSGYNYNFPPYILIGIIKKIVRPTNTLFYDIDVQLCTPFHAIQYVYVLKKKKKKKEKKELEERTTIHYE